MLCLPSRHITLQRLVVVAVVLAGAVLLCSSHAEALSSASPQERCYYLANPVEQPSSAHLVRQHGRQRATDASASVSLLPRHCGLSAPRALWERWCGAISRRPMPGQDRSGLACRAPPYTLPVFARVFHV